MRGISKFTSTCWMSEMVWCCSTQLTSIHVSTAASAFASAGAVPKLPTSSSTVEEPNQAGAS